MTVRRSEGSGAAGESEARSDTRMLALGHEPREVVMVVNRAGNESQPTTNKTSVGVKDGRDENRKYF